MAAGVSNASRPASSRALLSCTCTSGSVREAAAVLEPEAGAAVSAAVLDEAVEETVEEVVDSEAGVSACAAMCAHSKTHAQATEVRKQIMKKETVSQKKPAGSPGRTRFGKTAKKKPHQKRRGVGGWGLRCFFSASAAQGQKAVKERRTGPG